MESIKNNVKTSVFKNSRIPKVSYTEDVKKPPIRVRDSRDFCFDQKGLRIPCSTRKELRR